MGKALSLILHAADDALWVFGFLCVLAMVWFATAAAIYSITKDER